MRASSSSAKEPRARAWVFNAQFDVAEHTRFANSDTDQIFPEYIREFLDTRASYLSKHLKGLTLVSCSVPTTLTSCCDKGVVYMQGILHGSHLVNERTVHGLFDRINGVTAQWGALYFDQGEIGESFDSVFRTFLRESSLGGKDPALKFRVDYTGVSEARQPAIKKNDDRAKAWKFEALIDALHHTNLIDSRGEICSEYFHLHILQSITNWEKIKEAYDLISYSVQREMFSEHARGPVPMVG
jgi:hypothetical protein